MKSGFNIHNTPKAQALLKLWHREKHDETTILANREDIEAGFCLCGLVAKPNELGLWPQIYEIHESVIKPLLVQHGMVDRQAVLAEYRRLYGRFLADENLRRQVLPALRASGLVIQATHPDDRCKTLVCTPPNPLFLTTLVSRDRITRGSYRFPQGCTRGAIGLPKELATRHERL